MVHEERAPGLQIAANEAALTDGIGSSLYRLQLLDGFQRLRFRAPLEAEFRQDQLAQNGFRGRAAAIAASVLLFGLIGWVGLDYLLVGVVLLIVLVYLFLRVLFRPAVAVNVAVFAAFLGWAALLGMPASDLLYQSAVLAVASAICALGGYNMEYALREGFLEARLLRELAQRDGLTGLYNRRIFDAQLQRMWREAQRQRVSVGMLFFDIDQFKIYNDLYGHQAGDDCLRQVARVLENAVSPPGRRSFDICSRYGGDEFMLLLYDPSLRAIRELPEAIRRDVNALQIRHAGSAVAEHITVSVGVDWVWPGDPRATLAGAVQSADEALYRAKKEGRNRVAVGDFLRPPPATVPLAAAVVDAAGLRVPPIRRRSPPRIRRSPHAFRPH